MYFDQRGPAVPIPTCPALASGALWWCPAVPSVVSYTARSLGSAVCKTTTCWLSLAATLFLSTVLTHKMQQQDQWNMMRQHYKDMKAEIAALRTSLASAKEHEDGDLVSFLRRQKLPLLDRQTSLTEEENVLLRAQLDGKHSSLNLNIHQV